MLRAPPHTSLPCPSHLHPSVRLHNAGLWKERTEVLTETLPDLSEDVRSQSLLVCVL